MAPRSLLLLAATLALLAATLAGAGARRRGCPCITPDLSSAETMGSGDYIFRPAGLGGEGFVLPASYGSSTCAAHDNALAPYCKVGSMGVTTPPKYCAMEWYAAAAAAAAAHSSPESTWPSRTRRCYVDRSTCSMPFSKSRFFPGLSVYYSYEACGSDSSEVDEGGSTDSFSLIIATE
eukprot:5773745-Prymnesium_polylepis.1